MADQGGNGGEEGWREHAREVIKGEVDGENIGTCILSFSSFFFFLLFCLSLFSRIFRFFIDRL